MTIFQSPFGDVAPPKISVTQQVFDGIGADPDRVVIVDGPTGREMTAGELKAGVMSLAGGLNAAGYGKGSVTALMAPNMPEYATVFHGVAWAGGTVTTINPTYTASELNHQLTDAGARLLITVPMFLETAREGARGTPVERILVIGEAAGAEPLSSLMGTPQTEQTPVDLARDVVVLPYSSGTTGLPKGVMLSHDNLTVNVDQIRPLADNIPGERTIAFLPFFHIYGMVVIMNLQLADGGVLVTMPRFDLELFLQLMQDHKVRKVRVVPPVALALAKHPLVDKYDLSALEVVSSAAAPLGPETSQAVHNRLGCVSHQAYGMTELSPASHACCLRYNRLGAVGVPIGGTLSRIVGEDGRNLGPNEEGELWVKGPQVMLGYLNNPDATATTIVEDGWLRTGDLAEFDDDGYLYIRDRVKELIKVNAFQVPPAEIEAQLNAHPGIADAAVIGVPDDEAGERPVAFVVRAPGSEISEEEVKAHVAKDLAHYKHLAGVHFVDAIPKSASGKILRRLLRDQLAV